MHETDTRLITAAEQYVHGRLRTKISANRAEALADAIEDYKIACRLARGRDKSRSSLWSEIAERRRKSLTRRLVATKKAER